MAPYYPAKYDEECMWQDSTAAAEDVIQGNNGQPTIATDNYDTS
jgi:hypothetical protein